jgi:biopolymer transport protein ExbB
MSRPLAIALTSAWLLAAGSAAAAPPSDLLAAYKKEFAFLEAQKRALKARLSTLEAGNKRRVKAAETEVNRLQVRLIGLRGRADRAERELRGAERALPAADETDRVADTIDRARESLDKWGATLGSAKGPTAGDDKASAGKLGPDAQLALLTQAFDKAARRMVALGRVRVKPGAFFLQNGERTSGTLVEVGAIATYGVAKNGVAGLLAPAGAKRLKLWPKPAAAAAKAMAAGQRPDPLPIFLYESRAKNIDPKVTKTTLQFVRAGGLIGWVIVALGAVAALLILLRSLILLAAGLRGRSLAARLAGIISAGRLDEAAKLVRRAGGSLGRVLRATVDNLALSRQAQEDRISEAILREQPRLSRFGAVITVLAAVAPLLGLLGTVTGMISTFDIITEHGTGDPKLLSSGISEALVTTELGLIVAIPTLLVGTLLNGWSSSIEGSLERDALKLLNAHAGQAPPRASANDGDAFEQRAERQADAAPPLIGPPAPEAG